jgi:hypothetical protein
VSVCGVNERSAVDLLSFIPSTCPCRLRGGGIAMWLLSEDIRPHLGGFAIAPYYSHAGPAMMLGEEAMSSNNGPGEPSAAT